MNNSEESLKKRNKYYGLLIVAAIILPMVLAYAIFKTGFGFPSSTTNKGTLITPPKLIQELVLDDQANLNGLYKPEEGNTKKKWRILVPVTAACDEICKNYLYLTRQSHIRLAEKAYRVERILILLDSLSDPEIEKLKQEHPGTIIVSSTIASLSSLFSGVQLPLSPEQFFYLIDQNGYVMMRYGKENTGHDLLDDIKKLLKFTYDK